jgi:hypothetical protein
MATFRIFTNDRDYEKGVAMYSAFTDVEAQNAAIAENLQVWPRNPGGAPAKAIEWPARTEASKRWLKKHVGA